MQASGFEPGLRAWKARVLPDYTTPAQVDNNKTVYKFDGSSYSRLYPNHFVHYLIHVSIYARECVNSPSYLIKQRDFKTKI